LYRQELAGEIFSGQKIIFYAFLVFIFAYPSCKASYINHIDMIFDIRFLFIWKLLFTYEIAYICLILLHICLDKRHSKV